jgi:hypothetical protein
MTAASTEQNSLSPTELRLDRKACLRAALHAALNAEHVPLPYELAAAG